MAGLTRISHQEIYLYHKVTTHAIHPCEKYGFASKEGFSLLNRRTSV